MKSKFVSLTLAGVVLVSVFAASSGKAMAAAPIVEPGPPGSVQMLQEPLDEIDGVIQQGITDRYMAGSVVLAAKSGTIVKEDAYGYAARYLDDDFTEMENPVEMQTDTIFDLASITKVFTATAAMQLYEQGEFNLDDPVADYIPQFAQNGKSDVTIRQLLTHTSGFPAWIPLYQTTDSREEAYQEVFSTPLDHEPGTHYGYSDLNMITIGALIEKISGERLDQYIKANITEPLGMTDTMFSPPESLKDRIAATEYQPQTDREIVWGEVHDENAWAMDGVAGHAGLFSTAQDLAVFAQMILNDGQYDGTRILETETVEKMETNQLPDFPDNAHSLAWELNQDWYMGDLSGPTTMGHTGFTGTSIVIDPEKETVAILLTNKVHPTREAPSTNPIRQAVAGKTADAINAWSASTMKALVKDFAAEEEFSSDETAHSLKVHLAAVSHYEDQDAAAKVIKHMEGFKSLLDHQEGSMTEGVYETLRTDADYLINKWQ
ncbi:MAG TPA: serine hydrolase domain-containing protein [Lentibacillus sp.]|uniref:serine hydrolase domain-containing protein n=1 Tax=Lentibacillus sp. TaxID=1925746 RepID=UPI002B4B6660|nr:serine hydrolase domain-containing protein [Lentibacillus sp.]HLR63448.1 serine hydrolase domain-containing protein [Lentibacillus sp.]